MDSGRKLRRAMSRGPRSGSSSWPRGRAAGDAGRADAAGTRRGARPRPGLAHLSPVSAIC